MKGRCSVLAGGLAVAALSAGPSAERQAPFRSGTTSVSVNVSVRAGNVPVTGLTAADFTLTDSGVRQTIENVSVEAVPIDVTLILDTSGSAARAIGHLVAEARTMTALLRPTDRFRLLSIDTYVNQLIPLQPATNIVWPPRIPFNGASSVYDALVAAMIAPVEIDRRHLIVALTDGHDTISVLDAGMVRDVATRSEAVLHIVHYALEAAPPPVPRNWLPHRDRDLETLTGAAERTGGLFQRANQAGDGALTAFRDAFDDFRQSYVLRYTPSKVRPAGWHEIEVKIVRRGRFDVRARKGYFGG